MRTAWRGAERSLQEPGLDDGEPFGRQGGVRSRRRPCSRARLRSVAAAREPTCTALAVHWPCRGHCSAGLHPTATRRRRSRQRARSCGAAVIESEHGVAVGAGASRECIVCRQRMCGAVDIDIRYTHAHQTSLSKTCDLDSFWTGRRGANRRCVVCLYKPGPGRVLYYYDK